MGKVSRAEEQPRPGTTTTEAWGTRVCTPQQEAPSQEVHAPERRAVPLAATRESPRAAVKTQRSQK